MALNSCVGTDFQQGLWVFILLLTNLSFTSQIQYKKSFRLIIRKPMHMIKHLFRATEFPFSIGIDVLISEQSQRTRRQEAVMLTTLWPTLVRHCIKK